MTNINHLHRQRLGRQRGLVLFIALIALVAMSLAGVALMRSVDTSTLINGNLTFKQVATSSGDSGPEGAVGWLTTINASNSAIDPWTDASHPFNQDNTAVGYFSSVDGFDLFAEATWAAGHSAPGTGTNYDATGLDATTGNTVRYVVERMCRNANQILAESNCLFSDSSEDNCTKQVIPNPPPCNDSGSPIYRITARVTGPKNTVSYIQAYAY